MRVFVTGATGFVGSAVVRELIAAGHQVIGLCRSPEKAAGLSAAGAEVQAGSLEDLASLEAGAASADAIVHLAFNHDFSRFKANCEDDRRVIQVLGGAIAGTRKPLLITSGTGMANTVPGRPAREDGAVVSAEVIPRAASEEAAAALITAGVNVSVVRLPQVHDQVRQGLVTYLIAIAREKGVCAYVQDGGNRWPAAHQHDVAVLYRLALEKAQPGAIYHAVAEEGVSHREIAQALGDRLQLPAAPIPAHEAAAHFGWLTMFVLHDMPASSERTRQALGWRPQGPGLLADLRQLRLPAG